MAEARRMAFVMRMAEARRMAAHSSPCQFAWVVLLCIFFPPLKNTAPETRPLVRAPKWLRVRTANALALTEAANTLFSPILALHFEGQIEEFMSDEREC